MQINFQDNAMYAQNDKVIVHDFFSKILLIEDNIGDARLVELLLEEAEMDCEIINKTNLADGIEALEQDTYDAILLDLSLPDSRGFDTLESIMSRFPDANVIVLTGLRDKKLGLAAVKAGAQDYLVKGGFDSDWLEKVLRYSIERNRFLQRLEETQKIAKVGHWEYKIYAKEFTVSDEIYRILGYAPRSIDLNNVDLTNPEFHLHFFDEIIQLTISKGKYKGDRIAQKANGEELFMYVQTSNTKNSKGDIVAVQGVIQDITNRKVREQLEKDRDLAIESSKIKERLLTCVSHEMRTPMNAVLGMSNLVLNTNMNNEQSELVRGIQQSSEHLLGIINDILEISTLQNGEVKLDNDTFNLRAKLNNLKKIFQHKTKGNRIEFELEIKDDVPEFVYSDPDRLSQILINLVGNAFKFTLEGKVKVITERLEMPDKDQDWIKFSIEDTGVGIPEDKLGDIFEPFNRVESKQHNFEGTGLGLSISHNLVTKLNGGMGVSSVFGEGSVFYFELPFEKAKVKQQQQEDLPPMIINSTRTIHLLLAEDNKFNQIVAKKTIEREYDNIEVTIANNGLIATELLKENDFDIILMDLQMPIMDGYEATEYIRESLGSKKSQIPILAMTADALIAKGEKFKKYKMDDYVLKPFKPEQLFEKLAFYLNKNNI